MSDLIININLGAPQAEQPPENSFFPGLGDMVRQTHYAMNEARLGIVIDALAALVGVCDQNEIKAEAVDEAREIVEYWQKGKADDEGSDG